MTALTSELTWLDAKDIGIEGQGWADTESPYDRLPRKAERLLTNPDVWNFSKSPTGMCTHFRTNATEISVRWELMQEKWQEDQMNKCTFSGLDLYAKENGEWRWVACAVKYDNTLKPCVVIAEGLDGVERDYRLYFPLRNRLRKVEVGVASERMLEGIPPRATRPLVAYGTSILHGAYASRPGLVYPSRLGRMLDLPVINLGVSGSARMEPEVADLLLELDPAVYLLDTFPNMGLGLVNERLEAFLRKLSRGKPEVPIVLVEDFPRTNAWIMPAKQEVDVKCERIREIVQALQQEGLNLYFVEGHDLIGTDHEASIDGIHPNDVGYHRITENVYPVLKQAIKSRTKESHA